VWYKRSAFENVGLAGRPGALGCSTFEVPMIRTETDQALSGVLSEFARIMVTEFSIEAILDQLVHQIVAVLPITAAGVTLIDPKLEPRYVAASDDSAMHFEELQTELGEGPCVAAYRARTPILVDDLQTEHRFATFRVRALRIGLKAVFTFPLRQGESCLGALDLYRDATGALTAHETEAAQTLADVTAAYLANARGRAELQLASERSHERFLHDALTGLPNRMLLLERIEHAIVRSGRSRKVVAVLFIDLDNFKAVNDSFGHQVGDDLLVAVGERLERALRPADTVARISGDEFVVLCDELDRDEQVEVVASRVVDSLGTPFLISDLDVRISASVGIAFASQTNHDPEQLMHAADTAMYQVKRKGGANYQIINLRAHQLAQDHMDLRIALSKAEERGELRLVYQPIVGTADEKIAGVEALIRWDHPERGTIQPATTIPLAEHSGLIFELGRWVLEEACIDRKVADPSDRGLTMSVNVSAHQLIAPEFLAMVEAVLHDTDTDPQLLILEITEGALVRDTQRVRLVLTELKELGLALALDDFGTGYSSLAYLNRFPVDVVKIDQSFIEDLAGNTSSHAIVSKTIEMAHLLDLIVVCEGVETEAQHRVITELGSDLCQGFYFATPMSGECLEYQMRLQNGSIRLAANRKT
jgi:diguanylate cyclase (GGDEF)-like protein